MLKRFFLNTLSSFVGAWIAIGVCALGALMFFFGLVGKMAMTDSETEQLKKKSVLVLDLKGTIEEVEKSRSLDLNMLLRGNVDKPQTLHTLVKAIQEGAENSNIDALYLKCAGVQAAPATLHALREELVKFKKSGKPVYAYGDIYGQGDYYVASVADSIFLNPQGEVSLKGINGQVMFYKGLFDKLGITFQVFKVGTYKSAVEPYISESMSEPARAQLDTLYHNIWSIMRKEIADSRGISANNIDTLINRDHITFQRPEFAVKSKLVDRVVYEREMDDIFGKTVGKDGKDVNYVSGSFLASQTDWGQFQSSKNQVAVLYATGEIAENSDAGINYESLVPVILDLANNDDVKGVVLRVNSPGGSVFGTEQIWDALQYLKKKGKPLVVSMGDYAASGGYWISSASDYIFSDPMTITGSIGIFGLMPEASGLMSKLGINVETVGTNPGADFPSLFTPMSEQQKNAMQRFIEQGYDQFISRVSTGRKIPEAKVRQIAEGRVWDGVTAKKLGLVNEIGSLQSAIDYTAKKAGIAEKYNVGVYPTLEPGIWDFMPEAKVMDIAMRLRASYPQADMETIIMVARILNRNTIQARMPEFRILI